MGGGGWDASERVAREHVNVKVRSGHSNRGQHAAMMGGEFDEPHSTAANDCERAAETAWNEVRVSVSVCLFEMVLLTLYAELPTDEIDMGGFNFVRAGRTTKTLRVCECLEMRMGFLFGAMLRVHSTKANLCRLYEHNTYRRPVTAQHPLWTLHLLALLNQWRFLAATRVVRNLFNPTHKTNRRNLISLRRCAAKCVVCVCG